MPRARQRSPATLSRDYISHVWGPSAALVARVGSLCYWRSPFGILAIGLFGLSRRDSTRVNAARGTMSRFFTQPGVAAAPAERKWNANINQRAEITDRSRIHSRSAARAQSLVNVSFISASRKLDATSADAKGRRWNKRAFQRRSSEVEVSPRHSSLSGSQGHGCVDGPKSPISSRRRSSSIAVARPTPDLHRLLPRKSD